MTVFEQAMYEAALRIWRRVTSRHMTETVARSLSRRMHLAADAITDEKIIYELRSLAMEAAILANKIAESDVPKKGRRP